MTVCILLLLSRERSLVVVSLQLCLTFSPALSSERSASTAVREGSTGSPPQCAQQAPTAAGPERRTNRRLEGSSHARPGHHNAQVYSSPFILPILTHACYRFMVLPFEG